MAILAAHIEVLASKFNMKDVEKEDLSLMGTIQDEKPKCEIKNTSVKVKINKINGKTEQS